MYRIRVLVVAAAASLIAAVPYPEPKAVASPHPARVSAAGSTSAILDAEPVPEPELATETSTTVQTDEGQYVTDLFASPVNYQDETGEWLPIDNELIEGAGDVAAVNAANSYSVSIPEDASDSPVRFETEGAWVDMQLLGATAAAPEIEGAQAVFHDTADADEIVYEATNTGIKETIVLETPPSASLKFEYHLSTSDGLTPSLVSDGSIQFTDQMGEVAFFIPPGFMYDSASPDAHYSDAVSYELLQQSPGWLLSIEPDLEWLTSSNRIYPVSIDPTIDKATQKSCWLREESASTSYCGEPILKVGASDSLKRRRALIDFDLSGLPTNAVVSNATAWLYMVASATSGSGGATNYALFNPSLQWSSCASWAYSCTGNGAWTGGGAQGQISSNEQLLGGSGSGWQSWNITDRFNSWRAGTNEYRGVLLRQLNETTKKVLGFVSETHSNAGVRPLLRVTYVLNSAPSMTAPAVGPVRGTSGQTWTSPALSAKATDPDGNNVTIGFDVQTAAGAPVWSGWSGAVASGAQASVTVPAGNLLIDQNYRVRAYAKDVHGATSPWTSWVAFSVVEPGPEFPEDSPFDPTDPQATQFAGINMAELRDLERLAVHDGITVQQSVDRYAFQDELGEAVQQIAASHPEQYAYSELHNPITGDPTVHFKDSIPPAVNDVLSQVPVEVETLADASYTAEESLELAETAQSAIVDVERANDSNVVSYFDFADQAVVTHVVRPAPVPSAPTTAQLRTDARDEISSRGITAVTPDVAVTVSDTPTTEQAGFDALRGGVKIGPTKTNFSCTAGWPVKVVATGELGLITARHCDNNLTVYSADTRTARTRLDEASLFLSEKWGDIQYHRALNLGEKVVRQAYEAEGDPQKIKGTMQVGIGSGVCLYGRKTNGEKDGEDTCSTVRKY